MTSCEPDMLMLCHQIYLQVEKGQRFNICWAVNHNTFVLDKDKDKEALFYVVYLKQST